MAIWALGYATKTGLVAVSGDGHSKVVVKSTAVGNMFAPNPKEFVDHLLSVLQPEDVVLTPSGPNYTYIAGCASRCRVFWIHSGKLAEGSKNGSVAKAVLQHFQERPADFYEYQPTGVGLAKLRLMVQEWLGLERVVTATDNGLAQALRREREYFQYFSPEKDRWLKEFVTRERKKEIARLRKRGVVLSAEQIHGMEAALKQTAEAHYAIYFDGEGSGEKEQKKERERIITERLEWFGADELLAHVGKEVGEYLVTLPENKLFDGLLSEGTHRVKAEILAFMRNPLLYPNVRALLAYADMGHIEDGQVPQRRHGEVEHGNPQLRRTLCFDFAEKYWTNDTVGFFRNLYYAVKAHQYYSSWGLMQVTADVFKLLGKKEEEDESETSEDEPTKELVPDRLQAIVERLDSLSGLPMISRNPAIKREIAALKANPDPKRLWKLFARGKVGNEYGLNLQLTRKRVEQQVKRMLGITLIKATYYRWLKMLGMPLPLADDHIYVRQYQTVYGVKDLPEDFEPEVVLEYYRMKTAELKKRHGPLPAEIRIAFVSPDERLEVLKGMEPDEARRALSALSEKERKKLTEALALSA